MAVQANGWTPLLIAGGSGHVECVQALLDGGAVINQADVSYARLCRLDCATSRGLYVWVCIVARVGGLER